MHRSLTVVTAALAAGAFLAPTAPASADSLIFLSTQLRPIEEAQKMRDAILRDFPGEVEFIPEDEGPYQTRVRAEHQTGNVTIGVLGGLHGDFPPMLDALDPLDDIMDKLAERGFAESFVRLGRLGTDSQMYVPWMQATYVMAANRQALEHLPDGAELDSLTFEQLAEWAAAVNEATGERKLGFPAGPRGLMHRFFQGYLYPSYTGGVVRTFRSPEAVAMWEDFKELFALAHPRSTSYDFMQEPLLAEEVWIAWDHTARLLDALRQRPDDFVAFPAPAGPEGRGFMPVLAGLAIPAGTSDRAAAEALIDYLTTPAVQVTTLREVGFYPVVEAEMPQDVEPGIRLAAQAIDAQSGAGDALPSLLPVGLGELSGEFNKVYLDTFQRIVMRGQDVEEALAFEGDVLASIMERTGAPCWAPDAPSGDDPCPVE